MKKQKKSILVMAVMVAFVATGLSLPGLIGAGDLDPGVGVEKTGQTGCWDSSGTSVTCAGTGQDGELQKGVSWPVPRFTDNSDGTVTDNLTGLIWLKDANCPNSTNVWSDALTFANSLYDGWTSDGSGGDCGLSDDSSAGDWRLPNVKELGSLIDFGEYSSPALQSGHPFTNVQSSFYWSSTAYEAFAGSAWGVGMNKGDMNYYPKTTFSHYVWPVRGGN